MTVLVSVADQLKKMNAVFVMVTTLLVLTAMVFQMVMVW